MEKRNSFLTFVFSFVPGAGQMYLGMMRKGTVVIATFCAAIFFVGVTEIWELNVILPIIWCYSFFDTMNMKRVNEEARKAEEDKFISKLDVFLGRDWSGIIERKNTFIGIGILILGIFMIFERFISPIIYNICDIYGMYFIYDMLRNVPSVVVAVFLIIFGIRMVKSGNKNVSKKDFVEYGKNEKNKCVSENFEKSENNTVIPKSEDLLNSAEPLSEDEADVEFRGYKNSDRNKL